MKPVLGDSQIVMIPGAFLNKLSSQVAGMHWRSRSQQCWFRLASPTTQATALP